MNARILLSFIICTIGLPSCSRSQTTIGLEVGIKHYLCTQVRWNALHLDQFVNRDLQFGMFTEDKELSPGKELVVGAVGDILNGSATTGHSYLVIFYLGSNDSVVLDYEFIPTINNSSYAKYKNYLFSISPRFTLRIQNDTCATLNKNDKPPGEGVAANIESSLRKHLLFYETPYERIIVCRFSIDDPYAVALVYWRTARPKAYDVRLYDSEKPKKLSQLGRGDFLFGPAYDISPKLASRRCRG